MLICPDCDWDEDARVPGAEPGAGEAGAEAAGPGHPLSVQRRGQHQHQAAGPSLHTETCSLGGLGQGDLDILANLAWDVEMCFTLINCY